jgi:hypothetical protein
MTFLRSCLVLASLATQAFGIPTSGNDRRQTTVPSFVNTYGELSSQEDDKSDAFDSLVHSLTHKYSPHRIPSFNGGLFSFRFTGTAHKHPTGDQLCRSFRSS